MMLAGVAAVAGGVMASFVSLVERDWTLSLLNAGIVSGGVSLMAFTVSCHSRALQRRVAEAAVAEQGAAADGGGM